MKRLARRPSTSIPLALCTGQSGGAGGAEAVSKSMVRLLEGEAILDVFTQPTWQDRRRRLSASAVAALAHLCDDTLSAASIRGRRSLILWRCTGYLLVIVQGLESA